jgi:hypothetical protein
MARVNFQLRFHSSEMNALDVPLEIRRPDSSLVTRTVASDGVDLPAGSYYVSARLPGGQRLAQPFTIAADQTAPLDLTLQPDPEDESPHEWEGVSQFLQRRPTGRTSSASAPRPAGQTRSRGLTAPVAEVTPPLLRVFSGNAVAGTLTIEPAAHLMTLVNHDPGRVWHYRIAPSQRRLIAQFIQPGKAVYNMVLPVGPMQSALVAFSRTDDGAYHVEPHPEHSGADMMLGYCGQSVATAIDGTSRSASLNAEHLIDQKAGDPVAAAIGACAILRLGDLTRLHDWTANLYEWFPWLPDGAAIRGEHLARMGRHAEAARVLMMVPMRGLPIVADALFYAVERLKWYAHLDGSAAAGFDTPGAQRALSQLQPFASYVHRLRPLVSYSGIDPAKPDAAPVPAGFADPHAINPCVP